MGDEISLRKVDAYEKSLCPACGVHPEWMVFRDGETIESPALLQSPWAFASLLWGECTGCGRRLYEVQISVVPAAPPGVCLLNDRRYEAAGHALYLASWRRREWRLVHLPKVSKMSLAPLDPPAAGEWTREMDAPWLDEHNFGPMPWRKGWNSAVRLTETMLPVVRRITWPQS